MTIGKLYVPADVPAPVHEKVQKKLADHCGGFTRYDAQGGWVDDEGELIQEDVVVYEAVSEMAARDVRALFKWCARSVIELTDETEALAVVDGEKVSLR